MSCSCAADLRSGPFPQLGVFGAGWELLSVLAPRWSIRWRFSYGGGIRPLCGQRGLAAGTGIPLLPGPPCHGTFLEQAAERFGMFTFSRLVADLGTAALSVHNICGSCATFTIASPKGLGSQPGSGRPGVGIWKNVQPETDRGRIPPGGALDWGCGHAALFAAPVTLASVLPSGGQRPGSGL